VPDKIELTPDDIKNGWTEKTLTAYLEEREKANSESISTPRIVKPRSQVSYQPLRWRD